MKPTRDDPRLENPILQISTSLGESVPVQNRETWIDKQGKSSNRWAGAGFILGGLLLTAITAVEALMHQGQHLPLLMFRGFQTFGSVAFLGAAVGGFVLSRSRLARWLSTISIGYIAVWYGWQRYLPSIDWAVPRSILAGVLVVGGFWLFSGRQHSSTAAV